MCVAVVVSLSGAPGPAAGGESDNNMCLLHGWCCMHVAVLFRLVAAHLDLLQVGGGAEL
jgi:hypothetical protein